MFLKATYPVKNSTSGLTFMVMMLMVAGVVIVGLSSCASRMPKKIQGAFDNTLNAAQVHTQPNKFLSQQVRWGGKILNIENRQNTSRLTIVAFPLNSYGRPKNSDQSHGRFIAVVDKFLEPELYSKDREVTVTGILQKSETLKVGEFSYSHPVVQVNSHHLWVIKQTTSPNYMNHWWHDSWYNPYYPWPYPHHLHTH
jgi:outer membrane lipoprotein